VLSSLPLWRSLLYVPVNVDKYVDKAHTRGADCIQLDLEDSVPASEKERARSLVEAAARRVRQGGSDVVVRINRPLSLAVRDIEASIGEHVDALAISKVQSASHLHLLDELVSELERQRGLPLGHTRFIAIIETPAAYLQMAAIAASTNRLVAMTIGGEDFALAVGMEPTEDTLLLPKQQMIVAARSAGLMPLGFIASIASFHDREAFRSMVRHSRKFGFMGAGCIHPDQVAIVNQEYSPTEAEVAHAVRVIEGYANAQGVGRGSVAVDGAMIDAPVVERAKQLLDRNAAIKARAARNQQFR
jgi:citrate lyase subunit beta / citryl-CoA lyase